MRTGIEMRVAERLELGDGLFHFGPLFDWKLRIRKHPVGNEPTLEQAFRHAGPLRQRAEQLLGLPHLLLALSESVRGFNRCAHFESRSLKSQAPKRSSSLTHSQRRVSGSGISRSI